jgi:hypothetical protein
MAKWEYKTIKIEGTIKSIFGGKLDYDKQLNDLGAVGWELVNIVTMGSGGSTGVQAVFKRMVA